VYNYAGPMYREWANGQADKLANILNSARADHTNAVKARISNVKDLSGVIDITKDLFAVSKVRDKGRPKWRAYTDSALLSIGDRQARGSGVRARAEDHCGFRGQVRA